MLSFRSGCGSPGNESNPVGCGIFCLPHDFLKEEGRVPVEHPPDLCHQRTCMNQRPVAIFAIVVTVLVGAAIWFLNSDSAFHTVSEDATPAPPAKTATPPPNSTTTPPRPTPATPNPQNNTAVLPRPQITPPNPTSFQ